MCTYLYNDQDEKDAGSINMVNVQYYTKQFNVVNSCISVSTHRFCTLSYPYDNVQKR